MSSKIEELRSVSRQLVRELGILELDNSGYTAAHWHALLEISNAPGLNITELSELLVISLTKASRICNTLSKDGLIEYRIGADKRGKELVITGLGEDVVVKIDQFSYEKINRAFKYLKEADIEKIIHSIRSYANALTNSRLLVNSLKVMRITTSRTLRKQIAALIVDIQQAEFGIENAQSVNYALIHAEQEYYYNNSYNFWYVTESNGKIIGCIGLCRVNDYAAEVRNFYVLKEYRGMGVAKQLLDTLFKAAQKHKMSQLYLGSVSDARSAQRFYLKNQFKIIAKSELPSEFTTNMYDTVFMKLDL